MSIVDPGSNHRYVIDEGCDLEVSSHGVFASGPTYRIVCEAGWLWERVSEESLAEIEGIPSYSVSIMRLPGGERLYAVSLWENAALVGGDTLRLPRHRENASTVR